MLIKSLIWISILILIDPHIGLDSLSETLESTILYSKLVDNFDHKQTITNFAKATDSDQSEQIIWNAHKNLLKDEEIISVNRISDVLNKIFEFII